MKRVLRVRESNLIENIILDRGHIWEGKLNHTIVVNCACSSMHARGVIYDTEAKVYEKIIL